MQKAYNMGFRGVVESLKVNFWRYANTQKSIFIPTRPF